MLLPNMSSVFEWNPYEDTSKRSKMESDRGPESKSALDISSSSAGQEHSTSINKRRVNIKLNRLLLKDRKIDYIDGFKEDRLAS